MKTVNARRFLIAFLFLSQSLWSETSALAQTSEIQTTVSESGLPAKSTPAPAQRGFVSATEKSGFLEIQTSDGKYQITPYSNQIIESRFIANGHAEPYASHAVVMPPLSVQTGKTPKTGFKETAQSIVYSIENLQVRVQKSPLKISYWYRDKLLIEEQNAYVKNPDADILSFKLDTTEALYGSGARVLGMNRRGHRLPLYNKAHYGYEAHSVQMNFAMPLVFSSKMYGIHFDSPTTGWLDLDSKKDQVLAYETKQGRNTYQVIAGDNWAEIAGNYTALTGRQPMPARWVLGNFASRFGYHNEAQAKAIVEQFRAEKIPLDAIIFDLYWFGKELKGTMGNLEFDRESFPHPEKMMADFSAQGVKTILITEPFILSTSKKWNEAVQKKILGSNAQGEALSYDFYFGNTGLIDLFNPVAKTWFWDIYKNLKQAGVAGWWGDLGEPEVHPAEMRHVNPDAVANSPGTTYLTANRVHNIYGHEWAKLIAQSYARDFPEERPFILMRAGYSGSQRYGMLPWSGDVNRSWGGLQAQPEIALQMGMQGMAYMHSDLGGFAGANPDNELYARWLQYGVFQPVFRPHAQDDVAPEPVLREAATKQLAKAAIELRYQLMPYNYTLAFENNRNGLPLMRPLFYAEPDNQKLYGVADHYLWGQDFLVNPVLKSGQQNMTVYFPKSSHWFDFYSEQKYPGGTEQDIALSSDHIPVFVRAGAFIPMLPNSDKHPLIQTSKAYSLKQFDLHYYHDDSVQQSSGQVYDDNGELAGAYEKSAYTLLNFKSHFNKNNLSLQLAEQTGTNYTAIDRKLQMQIHHVQKKPKLLMQNHKKIAFQWDRTKQLVSFPLQWKAGQQAKIIMTW